MYFKVYAQNCKAIKPIIEINEKDLDDAIFPLVNNAIEGGLIEFTEDDQATNESINQAYAAARKQLEEEEILNCGDYCIVKQNDVPQERPNMCGYDSFIFED